VLAQVAEVHQREFLVARAELAVAKHHAGLNRHIDELLQRLRGSLKLRSFNTQDLLRDLEC
jgi:hypothetical protein